MTLNITFSVLPGGTKLRTNWCCCRFQKWVPTTRPRLNHICVRISPVCPTHPSVPSLLARCCVGTLPRWEPMWQYPITKSIKLLWHVKELHRINLGIMKVMSTWLYVIWIGYCHIGSQRGRVPTQVQARRPSIEGGVGQAGPIQTQMWLSPRPTTSTLVSP